LVILTAKKTKLERGKRLPLHSIHRWWSRRFSSIYRFLLASFLFTDEESVQRAIDEPKLMRKRSKGKIFMEPFAGGGTGISEAAFAGWSVYGVDINPVATSISKASLFLVTNGLPRGYEKIAIRVLDKSLTESQNIWKFDGKYASYIFISRDKAPTWISTRSVNNRQILVLMCPNCYTIFESSEKQTNCPTCGHRFEAGIKGSTELKNSFPETIKGWKIYAIELRNPKNKWKKEYKSPIHEKEIRKWLRKSSKEAEKIREEIIDEVDLAINVDEGRRLLREAQIEKYYQLFTTRQLASFYLFSLESRKLARNRRDKLFLAIALSESTKASSLVAKWHPPIGEPVPAGAMKTYWVPKHTVESNPLAHIPGTLRPLGRNTIASAIRMQLRADTFIKENGGPSNSKVKIVTGDAEQIKIPRLVDLAVVDPPYMDAVKSYASLSLIHYIGIKLFDSVNMSRFVSSTSLKKVEDVEISRERKEYEEKLYKIFTKLTERLHNKSRVVLMYNRLTTHDWLPPLRAAKLAGLFPTSIYWVPGESPGGLARSKLRGIYLIVLRKSEKPNKIPILFEEIIEELDDTYPVDTEVELESYKALNEALKVFDP
jgi:adenine-specific DNA methylase